MAMEAQFQIRQNAMEMQDYMKDLFQWQKEIKQKDKSIKKNGLANAVDSKVTTPGGVKNSSLPAPRGRAAAQTIAAAPENLQTPSIMPATYKTSSSKPLHSKNEQSKKNKNALLADGKIVNTAASHTYAAYKKWDKFDVDSALKSDDSGSESEEVIQKAGQRATSSQPSNKISPTPYMKPGHAQPPIDTSPASSLYPRETLPASELHERSTTRTAASPASVSASAAPASSSSAPRLVDEHDLPPIRSQEPQTAEAWRARGNDLFKIGHWASALECYSRSIDLEPTCLSYANRAMSKLKLGDWEAAVKDCDDALRLDPCYTKAYHRRGTARKQLMMFEEAGADFEEALRLEPANSAVRSERDACLAEAMKSEGLKEGLKRVRVSVLAMPQGVKPSLDISETANGHLDSCSLQGSQQDGADGGKGAAPAAAAAAYSGRTLQGTGSPTVASTAAAALKARMSFQAPKTSTEFESTWRSLSGDQNLQASYLKLISPEYLPSIFKSSLTPQVLVSFVKTALQEIVRIHEDQEKGGKVCHGASSEVEQFSLQLKMLTKVPRFDMTVMCIPGRDKVALGEAWSAAYKDNSNIEHQSIRKMYRF
ncbi:hypothetical protein CEUSTIGMA_g10031.t1 [Chlamydomonas eustigma]|uniref:RNA-polymerase II-associated protein 3-like C-terminal domain-containing protein n=1 Tax=Chlamydomonas eustigma TaxID=1157962 RepID=A0A250XHP4_9CHLO|nr:hypothetical protein CEUSTIGMA_g10031.t1 [Chlamydomonas eustigma]|eukprot:GAX82605.1 hypothetical protein CEUSTIGMA_g10031.t1 [Chlamydomonas eustigma]